LGLNIRIEHSEQELDGLIKTSPTTKPWLLCIPDLKETAPEEVEISIAKLISKYPYLDQSMSSITDIIAPDIPLP
jgi:hypothetical protein